VRLNGISEKKKISKRIQVRPSDFEGIASRRNADPPTLRPGGLVIELVGGVAVSTGGVYASDCISRRFKVCSEGSSTTT